MHQHTKIWIKLLPAFLLFQPFVLRSDDADFDDDAFLAENASLPNSSELLGFSIIHGADEDKYVIKFNNVSIIEYLHFVGRISKINFQFEEGDLNFNITVMSDDPLTIQNILSTLIQTLRARGFSLLEQDNNLLITRSTDINQIATLVTPDNPNNKKDSPIVTRVFRIQNATLNSVASIIRPMISKGAMLDVSAETKQLIVTDITTNVDKIAGLIVALDTPHSPLEMEIYRAQHMPAESLITMAKQLVEPFSEGNPLIYVPQPETNSVFIVSTPFLIERSIAVMEDLDNKPKSVKGGGLGDQVFLYPLVNKSAPELLAALKEVAKELEGTGAQATKLISTIHSAKWIKESNSILFITDAVTLTKLEELLKTLDSLADTHNYYVYKIQKAGRGQVERSLEQLAKTLKKGAANRDLVDAINSMRYISETNSFVFTGTDEALKKLKELLPTFEIAAAEFSPSSHYWLYTPQYLSGKELEDALAKLDKSLISAGLADPALLKTIKSMKWVPATNTLLFTGDPASIDHVQAILKLIDVPTGSPSKIYLYKPKFITNEQIEEALDELANKLDRKNLTDRNLASAIDNMTWIRDSQIFLFKADPGTIDKIDAFLKDIDSVKEADSMANAYFLYKLKFARGDDVIDHLMKIAKGLSDKDPSQKALINVIDKATFLKDTNAILLTGSQKAVEEVKALITQFDDKDAVTTSYEKTAFFIYKPVHLGPTELEKALKETARDLKESGLIDATLLQSIDTLRIVDMTGSLIFTGTKESLEKTKEIIATLDVAGLKKLAAEELEGQTFYLYKVRYVPIAKLLKILQDFAQTLEKTPTPQNRVLINAINSAKEIKESNSLLFTGPSSVLTKIAELLKEFDTPGGVEEARGKEGERVPRAPGTYVVYKPVHVSGPELLEMIKDFEQNLERSGVKDPGLFETIDNLKYIERTGFILISGDQQSVDKVKELLQKFDVQGTGAITPLNQIKTSFMVYKLQYHQGGELQETLKKVAADLATGNPQTLSNLLNAINSIQWIKMTNSLLATGTPDVLSQLKELIKNIDTPLRQVFIEVLIIQTRIFDNQQFGLQWGSKVQYLNRFAGGVSNFPSPSAEGGNANLSLSGSLALVDATRTPVATDIPNPVGIFNPATNGTGFPGGFDLGVIGDIILHRGKSFISLASLVNALEADNDAIVVLNPKIIAQDNQQSTIFVGENIPFTGSNVTTIQGGGSQIQANIEYRDVGISLAVTPILGTNDIITLDITNEITAQVPNTTSGASITGLQTSRTSLNARVHVPNKHFVALSGLIHDENHRFRSGIPCLGGLPVIGAIFSENDRANTRNNVIFFIRPVIIDSIEEYEKVTQNQEQLYKDDGSKQIIKEQIDEAIDRIRNPYCND